MIRLLPVSCGELIVIEVNLPGAGVILPICILFTLPSTELVTANPAVGVIDTF